MGKGWSCGWMQWGGWAWQSSGMVPLLKACAQVNGIDGKAHFSWAFVLKPEGFSFEMQRLPCFFGSWESDLRHVLAPKCVMPFSPIWSFLTERSSHSRACHVRVASRPMCSLVCDEIHMSLLGQQASRLR